jgi:hypothetical protein
MWSALRLLHSISMFFVVMALAAPASFGQETPPPAKEPAKTKEKPNRAKAFGDVFTRQTTRTRAAEFLRAATQGKDALVRKHAALALGRMGTSARTVSADLKAAIQTEKEAEVKEALESALEAIDPPLEKVPVNELLARLSDEPQDVESRRAIIKVLGELRISLGGRAYFVLEQFLLDEELAADAAAALEKLEQARREREKRPKTK